MSSVMASGCSMWMAASWTKRSWMSFAPHNVALRKQLEEQKKRFEGIDPDEVRKLAEEKQKLEEAQQLKLGEVDKVLENRLKTARADWDKQFATVTAERDALNARLTAIQIDQGVITVATKTRAAPDGDS